VSFGRTLRGCEGVVCLLVGHCVVVKVLCVFW